MTNTRDILEALATGKIDIEEAERELRSLAVARVGDIGMIDVNRQERSGVPEVVFAESKNKETLVEIVGAMVKKKEAVLLTRVNAAKLDALRTSLRHLSFDVNGHEDHLTVLVHTTEWSEPPKKGKIAIITAGTSDIAYAREAEAISRVMGVEALTFYDIGV
ncbi:MAG: hypothetical protein ACFFD6_09125, partial [Candidatus Thorarchaeota archaeon]